VGGLAFKDEKRYYSNSRRAGSIVLTIDSALRFSASVKSSVEWDYFGSVDDTRSSVILG